MKLPVVVLNGPTASGKSRLAIELAKRLIDSGQPTEIVNADSMLVYQGMDIGTAKPTMHERAGIPHHLIDIWSIDRMADVATFQELARDVIGQLRARGVVPILVGGSALYVHAIVDEFDFPGSNESVRTQLEHELELHGPKQLYERLVALAPDAAALIEPNNGRRIVRALEIHSITGTVRAQLPQWHYAIPPVIQFGIDVDREILDQRINERVDQMWESGLVGEVEYLVQAGLRDTRTASRAIGYRQMLDYLDGVSTEAQVRDRIASATRKFARKQLGWFRRDDRIVWLSSNDPVRLADEAMTRITEELSNCV